MYELLTDHYFFEPPRSTERAISPAALFAFAEPVVVNFAHGGGVFFGYAGPFLRNSDFGNVAF